MGQITPRKQRGPKITDAEKRFVMAYSATGDRAYSESEAGLPVGAGIRVLNLPEVKHKILETSRTRLITEGMPAALNALLDVISNEKSNAMARVSAAKTILSVGLDREAQVADKRMEEMTAEELDDYIAKLSVVAAAGPRIMDEDLPDDGFYDSARPGANPRVNNNIVTGDEEEDEDIVGISLIEYSVVEQIDEKE